MSTGPTENATSTVPLIITPGDLPPFQTSPSSKESPSPLPSISTGAIVSIAVGAVVILMLLSLICICCKKKKRRRDEERCAREQSQRQSRRQSQNSNSPSPAPIQSGQLLDVTPPTLSAPALVSSCGGSGSKHSGRKLPPPPSLGTGLKSGTNKMGYEELAYLTDNFSEANFLGKGGFGDVHKGIYPNGDEIAVKQLKTESEQGEREFQAEVDIISRVHHKHAVSLVGYCITGSKRLLAYQFVPNNTLEFHLHEKGLPTMDWSKRMRIALGSGKGLEYLHENCHHKIIHGDIKSANILLDFNFEAKVADFGLAKITSNLNTHVSTRVIGTFGYMAPEYVSSGQLTDRSDVFSYGVILFELITGRKPIDNLVEEARRAGKENNVDSLVDSRLQKKFDPNEMTRMVACATACTHRIANRRPVMRRVVQALEGFVRLEDLKSEVTL